MLRPGRKITLQLEITADPENDSNWGVNFKDLGDLDMHEMFQLWIFLAYRLHNEEGVPWQGGAIMEAVMEAFEMMAKVLREEEEQKKEQAS